MLGLAIILMGIRASECHKCKYSLHKYQSFFLIDLLSSNTVLEEVIELRKKICEWFTFSVPSTRTGNCCSTCAKFHFRCNRVPWWKRREYFFAVVVDIRCQYIEDVFLHISFYFFGMEKRRLKRVVIMVFVVTKERNEICEKRGKLKSTCYCSSSSVVNGKVFVVFTDCNF